MTPLELHVTSKKLLFQQLHGYPSHTNVRNVEWECGNLLKYQLPLNSFRVLDSCRELVWEELHVTMVTTCAKITACTVL